MERELVVESGMCLYSGIDNHVEVAKAYAEANIKSGKGLAAQCLRIELPVGYVDKDTANGNYYESVEMNKALEIAKEQMAQGLVHGTHGNHPEGRAELNPDEISHLVTKAWVDPKTKLLWNEWLVIPTEKGGGKDLIQLFLAGASVGTSIRGLAVREDNRYMRHYTFKGTDTVGVPSTGIYPGINNETVKATIKMESMKDVKKYPVIEGMVEGMNSESNLMKEIVSISESLKSVEDKAGAAELVKLGSKLAKLEASVMEGSNKDSKELEELKTQISELQAMKESLEKSANESATEAKTFEKAVESLKEQVQDAEAAYESKLESSVSVIEGLRDKYKELEETTVKVEDADEAISTVKDYALRLESVLEAAKDYILKLEATIEDLKENTLENKDNAETLKDYALKLESALCELRDSHKTKNSAFEVAEQAVVELRNQINGSPIKLPGKSINTENFVKNLIAQYPKLKLFAEELHSCTTIASIQSHAQKYLDIVDKAGLLKAESESKSTKSRRTAVERYMPGDWK